MISSLQWFTFMILLTFMNINNTCLSFNHSIKSDITIQSTASIDTIIDYNALSKQYSIHNIIEMMIEEEHMNYLKQDRLNKSSTLTSAFDLYRLQHSRDAVLQDAGNICHRRFLSARLICSHAGNRVAEFLIEFAWAFIYNRTFLVDFHPSNCYGAIAPYDWILLQSDDRIMSLYQNAGCPIYDPRNRSTEAVQLHTSGAFHCCNFDSADYFVIRVGGPRPLITGFRDESSIAHPTMTKIRQRADMLFYPSYESEGYLGFIADFLFNISYAIHELIDAPLREIYDHDHRSHHLPEYRHNQVTIGIHLRHQKLGNESILDDRALHCLQILRAQIPHDWRCLLLVASDRLTTIDNITALSSSFGCEVQVAQRSMVMDNAWGNMSSTTAFSEQGPWQNSIISMADYYLLSRSQVLLGTAGSSFSQLIASWAAARSTMRGAMANNFVLINNRDHDSNLCMMNPPRLKVTKCNSKEDFHYSMQNKTCIIQK